MKIYEYYCTDINKQELFYTACKSEIEFRFDRDTTGKVFEADMPEGVKIVSFEGIESLCTADGRHLFIHRRDDGKFFLVFSFPVVECGCEWYECIYSGIDAVAVEE